VLKNVQILEWVMITYYICGPEYFWYFIQYVNYFYLAVYNKMLQGTYSTLP